MEKVPCIPCSSRKSFSSDPDAVLCCLVSFAVGWGVDFVQSFDEPREGFMPVDLEVVCVCAGVTDHMGVQIRMPLKL